MACSTMGDSKGVYKVLVEKPEEQRPLRRPRRRWDDNIKMDLQEVGWRLAWTRLIWLKIRSGSRHKRGNEPSGSKK